MREPQLAPPPRPRRGSPLLDLLTHDRFGLLLGGNLLSAVGTFVHVAVTAWILFELTGSSAMVGILTVAQYAPIVMLTLPAGILVDVRDRRRSLVVIIAVQMLLAFFLAWLVWAGHATPLALVSVTAGMGICSAFGGPAWISYVGEVVPPERVMLGFSLNSVSFHLAAMLGPPLGAVLLGWVGADGSFALNGLSFLAIIAALWLMPRATRPPSAFPGLRRAVREMYRFARISHRARRLLPVSSAIALVAFGLPAVLPAYATDVLGGSAESYGTLAGALGAGSLSGAVVLGLLSSRFARRTIILLGAWCVAAGMVGLAASSSASVALPSMVGVGAGQLMLLVTARTVIQMDAPEWLRARAVSLWFMAAVGLGPLGGMLLGWMTDAWGIEVAVGAGAAYTVVLALALSLASRSRARMVTPYESIVDGTGR